MTRRMRIDDLTEIATPQQVALSPDGSHIAYVLQTVDEDEDRVMHRLWMVGSSAGEPRQLTAGDSDSAPAWSPDGSTLAFLRAQDGPAQLHLLPLDGGDPRQLTTLPLGAGAPVWSPDGTRLAFGAPVDLIASASEDDATRTARRNAPIVADRLDYQADGTGLLRTTRTHLHVLELDDGHCRQVTDGDWHAGRPAWSPDGGRLAFAAPVGADPDLTMHAAAHVLDLADLDAGPRVVGPTDGMVGTALWTADGLALLAVATTAGPTGHANLLRIPLDGGEMTNVTAPLDRNLMPGGGAYPGALPQLFDDGRSVLFCARDRGCSHLYAIAADSDGKQLPRLVLGGEANVVSGASVAGNTAAVVLATAGSFGEVVMLDLTSGARTVRTAHGANLEQVELFTRTACEFTISDGTVVHGWLIRDERAAGPQPLLLDVHGGPHNAWNGAADEVHLYHQELAARGWAVLLLNPRASDGYGESFYTATQGSWGETDAKDLLEPLDQLVAQGIADPKRLAVSGYSYGGFMSCYLTSRDDRFAAAVTGGVVSDLTSLAGTGDAGHFLGAFELGGQPWALPERYRTMSPFSQVDRVNTPTLILQGTEDVRCPMGQAEQWHTALRERGVPTQMVLYPGGSHLFIIEGPPSHRLDFNRRIFDWVEQYAGGASGRRRPRIDAAHWQRRLTALAAHHQVPGATLGILRIRPGIDDELVQAATGVLSRATEVAVTTDSVFQIGSISKVWTATMVMQLVDEGLLDLDAPIVEVLPELTLSDPIVTAQVTMRHLLTHTSGIDGDVFTDTGRGDDCVERYVAQLDAVAQNHPLGVTWSYCNSGFVLMGRVIEKLTGLTWDDALRERISKPLGLRNTVTLPEEAILRRAAVGHVSEGDEEPAPAPVWVLPRSVGPAGLITSTVADLLSFARMHLAGGTTADGTRVLSATSAAQMTEKQAELPDRNSLGDSWGLGWIRFGWDGQRLYGHDGNTIGQSAFLRILPAEGLAVALLTNGGHTPDLYHDLYREIFAELAGVAMPYPLTPPAEPINVDPSAHVGLYERAGSRSEVLERDGKLILRQTATGPLAVLTSEPTREYELVAADESGDLFLFRHDQVRTWTPVTFYTLPAGERYMHFGVRATPKIE